MPLTNTRPASIRSASRLPRSGSPVQRFEPRPKSESLAIAIASSSPSARTTAATGPNVSSRNAGISRVTPLRTVGSK